jgi:hypothetical protein
MAKKESSIDTGDILSFLDPTLIMGGLLQSADIGGDEEDANEDGTPTQGFFDNLAKQQSKMSKTLQKHFRDQGMDEEEVLSLSSAGVAGVPIAIGAINSKKFEEIMKRAGEIASQNKNLDPKEFKAIIFESVKDVGGASDEVAESISEMYVNKAKQAAAKTGVSMDRSAKKALESGLGEELGNKGVLKREFEMAEDIGDELGKRMDEGKKTAKEAGKEAKRLGKEATEANFKNVGKRISKPKSPFRIGFRGQPVGSGAIGPNVPKREVLPSEELAKKATGKPKSALGKSMTDLVESKPKGVFEKMSDAIEGRKTKQAAKEGIADVLARTTSDTAGGSIIERAGKEAAKDAPVGNLAKFMKMAKKIPHIKKALLLGGLIGGSALLPQDEEEVVEEKGREISLTPVGPKPPKEEDDFLSEIGARAIETSRRKREEARKRAGGKR